MQRKMLCNECIAGRWDLLPEDRERGFCIRNVPLTINSTPPAGHGFRASGYFQPMPNVICDACADNLDGEIAFAQTVWDTNKEGSPGPWEAEYGQPMTMDAYLLARKLKEKV